MPLRRAARVSQLLVILLAVSVAITAILIYSLATDLRQSEEEAGQANLNLSRAMISELERGTELGDLLLTSVSEALQQPDLKALTPELRRFVLFSHSLAQPYLSSLFLTDAAGKVTESSFGQEDAESINVGDRDYFTVHRNSPAVGLYLSQPFVSRLRGGAPSIAFSRRLNGPDGTFAGIVAGVMRMSYFYDLIGRMQLSSGAVILVMRQDGRILVRVPSVGPPSGEEDPLVSAAGPVVIPDRPDGTVKRQSPIDGIWRIYSFVRARNAPFIVSVGQSVDLVHARWWNRVRLLAAAGSMFVLAVLVLVHLLRGVSRRRISMEEKLLELARADPLTGLANRRVFNERAAQEWGRSNRSGLALSILMIDLDGFKAYNDSAGHIDGDALLVAMAKIFAARARRPGDLAARFGGDEFALVLPETPVEAAQSIASALQREVEAMRPASPCRVTLSIGIASAVAGGYVPVEKLIECADAALYAAKRGGRNQVVVGRM